MMEIISSGITAPMQDVTIGLGASVALTAAAANDIDEQVSGSGTSHQADVCTYQWSASGNQGSFTSTSQQTTTWTAPNSPGSYTITLRVDDLNDTNRPTGESAVENWRPRATRVPVLAGFQSSAVW